MPHAAAPAGAAQLSLLTINVNGLGDRRKRQTLFNSLEQLGCDVVVLLETHCSGSDEAAAWLRGGAGEGRPWLGAAHWAHGAANARGVGILFKRSFSASQITVDYAAQNGRALRVSWIDEQQQQPMAVVAAYAPTEDAQGPQQHFFGATGELAAALDAGDPAAHVLLCGDFNCVLEAADSTAPNAAAQAAKRGACALRSLITQHNLTDLWLTHRTAMPPQSAAFGGAGDARFTHWPAAGAARRLDRVYASAPLAAAAAGAVRECCHLPLGALPGDHCAVRVDLGPTRRRAGGRSQWRLPLALLSDDAFRAAVEADLAAMLAGSGYWTQWATASGGERWELFKRRVQEEARTRWGQKRSARAARVATQSAAVVLCFAFTILQVSSLLHEEGEDQGLRDSREQLTYLE